MSQHPTTAPGRDSARPARYAPLFFLEEVGPDAESVELHTPCRWWCQEDAEIHGDRCRGGMGLFPALDDLGNRWDVAAELAAARFHGIYEPAASTVAASWTDWVALTFEARHGQPHEQTVHVTPAAARSLAARLLHLADTAESIGAAARRGGDAR